MSLKSIASAPEINLRGARCVQVTGTDTIQTISGVADGQDYILHPSDALPLSDVGNLHPVTTVCTPGRPVHFLCVGGDLYEIEPEPVVEVENLPAFGGDSGFTSDSAFSANGGWGGCIKW